MEQVDVIGTDAVCKLILTSKLAKFIIFKKGYLKGTTPLFKCVDSRTPKEASDGFRNWANTLLSSNPSNNLPYEIMLYEASETEESIDEDLDDGGKINKRGKQKNRSKFSFTLNPYNNMMMGQMNGGMSIGEVERLLNERDQKRELADLKRENERLRAGLEEEDDEDDDISNSTLSKAVEFMREANKNARLKLKSKGVEISGEDDDDDDDDDLDDDDDEEEIDEDEEVGDDEEEEEEDDDDDDDDDEPKRKKKKKGSSEGITLEKKKAQRIIKAIRVLKKGNPKLDSDLMKLALLSVRKPKIYKNMLIQLRGLSI